MINPMHTNTHTYMYAHTYTPTHAHTHAYTCCSVGSGTWKGEGLTMMKKEVSLDGSKVTIYCSSTHLTSFAILVDVSGTLDPGVSISIRGYGRVHVLGTCAYQIKWSLCILNTGKF